MENKIKIALAGAGIVGSSLAKLIANKHELLAKKSGHHITIKHLSVRDPSVDRGFDQSDMVIWEDAMKMAETADYDLFIELIGGQSGVALMAAKKALQRGKNLVTANKAMMAHHGKELTKLASLHHANIGYEAAVAASIPIIKALREGLIGNDFHHIYGILNGTSNYILSAMNHEGWDFSTALGEAQKKGYAEADPSFDINGTDCAHKLALLTGLAFGVWPDFNAISIRGIEDITAQDHLYANKLGKKIKLLGEAVLDDGKILQQVEPVMVVNEAPIAAIEGVTNGVISVGDLVGETIMEGAGAGGDATASAVMADIMDMICNRHTPIFGLPANDLKNIEMADPTDWVAPWYMRLHIEDRAGVLAEITDILREYDISLETIMQYGHQTGQPVDLVMVTHGAKNGAMKQAIQKINQCDCLSNKAQLLRIMT